MTTGIIILCRYGSKRLPGKILKFIKGKPIIENIYLRTRQCKNIDKIIVATSEDETDDPIAKFCYSKGIELYRGSLEDVANRFLSCALTYNLDYAIRINGDNVFIDTDLIDKMVETAHHEKLDFCSNVPARTFPFGMSIEILNTNFYQECYDQFTTEDHYEHVTKYIYDNQGLGKRKYIVNTQYKELQGIQLAVDTEADYLKAINLAGKLEDFPKKYDIQDFCEILKNVQT